MVHYPEPKPTIKDHLFCVLFVVSFSITCFGIGIALAEVIN